MKRIKFSMKCFCVLCLLLVLRNKSYSQSNEYTFEPKQLTDWTGYISYNSLGYHHNEPNIKFGRANNLMDNRYRGWAVFNLGPFYDLYDVDDIIVTRVGLVVKPVYIGEFFPYLEIKRLNRFNPITESDNNIYNTIGNAATYTKTIGYLFDEFGNEIPDLGASAKNDFQAALQNSFNEFYIGFQASAENEDIIDSEVELDGYDHFDLEGDNPMPKLKITWEYKRINVTVPNSSTSWQIGTPETINWDDNISENVKIELYKGSSLIKTIESSTPSDGNQLWPITSDLLPGSNYRIKITSTTISSVYAFSDPFNIYSPCPDSYETNNSIETATAGAFSSLGTSSYSHSITATLHNSTDVDIYTLNVIEKGTIDVNLPNPPADYNIKLTTSSGGLLASSYTTGSETFTYTFSSAGYYYLWVYSSIHEYSCTSYSLGVQWTPTTIIPAITVTSPNGGENWQVGSNQNITWTSKGTSGTVRILYSTNNGSSWTTLISSTTDDGSYPWTVPDAPSTSCLIRINDTDGSPIDQSNSVFTISSVPAITVISPNGGENWLVGSNQNITWNSTGTSGTVRILYSTNNGSSWTTLITSTADDGSYPWTVPEAPSTSCLIRINDTDGSPIDQSNSVFTISSVPAITVTSPNGGENWQVGSIHNITWTSTGLSGYIRIEYSIDNGSIFNTLIASTPDDGSYNWTIPNLPSTTCLVRVCDTDGNPADQSNGTFIIRECNPPEQPGLITGLISVCYESSQTYNVQPIIGATSYTWTLPSGWSGSSSSTSINAIVGSSAGIISVIANNSCGSSSSRTLSVSVTATPSQPGAISGLTSVCQGSSQTYSISSVAGATSYTWTLPSGWSGNSTSTSIPATVGASGGTISVTANNSCGSSSSHTLSVSVTATPSQPGAISGLTSVCQGSSQTFSISSVAGATSYTWTLPSGWSGSSTSTSINVNVGSNAGTISVIANNLCGSSNPRTLIIAVASKPIVTTASVRGDTPSTALGGGEVTSNGGADITERGVCWSTTVNPTISDSKSSDGISIGSFTSILTNLTNEVSYHVRAFATNFCGTSYGSDFQYTHHPGGIEDSQSNEISIYPNPVSGILNIEYKNENYKAINILNSQGILLEKEMVITPKQQLDFSKYEYGLYILEFINSRGVVKRIKVVNH